MTPKQFKNIFSLLIFAVCMAVLYVAIDSTKAIRSSALWSSIGTLGIVAALAGCMLVAAFLLLLPGIIAAHRKHSKTEAIQACSLVGLFFFPAWCVALVWAFTEDNSNKLMGYSARPDRTLPLDELGKPIRMP
ncbi:MAG: superinfection immunity protein [Planctomycetes bacterium]|jgi:hypothetical protein|nr:superinfection immunity protein [Planctomycetota bacterium]OQZ07202.1 MAG: hypothetical protein B6D36_01080 [Planctomycetes bacterium UTPLA1]